jgi:hypothetical protein
MLEPPRDVSRLSSMAPHLDDAPESGHDDPFRKAGVGPHWGHNWRGSDGTRGGSKGRETAVHRPFRTHCPW